MFGLGFWEIAVVVLLAVTLFPPKEIPKLARSVARAYGTVRRTAEEFRTQIMVDEDLRAPLDEVRSAYNDARWQVSQVQRDAREQLRKAEREAKTAMSSTTEAPPAIAAAGDASAAPPADPESGATELEGAPEAEASTEDSAVRPLGYRGAARPAAGPDPRFDASDEEDAGDDDEGILEATADPDDPASELPRLPAPPQLGDKSRSRVI